ncbi:hypothetical protein PDIG_06900 [Penicillium digitatum PHI26]|uniref:Uncharacterized protein n=2 Tax=Penicillium digitatum TaxID=36651 RepID=K9GCE0_PEND2|nr:hypothetical protein PDIP_11550 [Penicillium digitatum Pd1]EKV18817.1 hypothetical protein PDIG_06900 [Penicillium digitatum PHI26]EKV20927.1 hypothetical protein PDIP_11550 [Penicillium digitatum Pd1]
MVSCDTWINPFIRYRITQNSLKEMQEDLDMELGQFDDVDVQVGTTLKETMTLFNEDHYRTPEKKTLLKLSDCHTPLRLPKFLKIRVYWARLLGW